MSAQTIGVMVVGLLVGYWVASALLDAWAARGNPKVPSVERDAQLWWEVLQVAPDATLETVHDAYRAQISQYHPDKVARLGVELKALAEKKSKEINAAYEQALQERGLR